MLHALATMSTATTVILTMVVPTTVMLTTAEGTENRQAEERQDSQSTRAEFAFHEIESKLIAATNEARAQHGLPPLQVDYTLMRSARRHAAWMVRSRSLAHTSAMVAENIAMGQRSVRGAIQSWMSSPGHRANMLSGRYRRLGVAAYRTPDGTIFWCQQFLW